MAARLGVESSSAMIRRRRSISRLTTMILTSFTPRSGRRIGKNIKCRAGARAADSSRAPMPARRGRRSPETAVCRMPAWSARLESRCRGPTRNGFMRWSSTIAAGYFGARTPGKPGPESTATVRFGSGPSTTPTSSPTPRPPTSCTSKTPRYSGRLMAARRSRALATGPTATSMISGLTPMIRPTSWSAMTGEARYRPPQPANGPSRISRPRNGITPSPPSTFPTTSADRNRTTARFASRTTGTRLRSGWVAPEALAAHPTRPAISRPAAWPRPIRRAVASRVISPPIRLTLTSSTRGPTTEPMSTSSTGGWAPPAR